jgi:hypothetical protein
VSATRSVRVERLAYADVILIDRMHTIGQLSDRQHSAAARLYRLHVAAGLTPRITPRVDAMRVDDDLDDWSGEVPDAADGETPAEAARRAYRAALRDLGDYLGCLLDALMLGQHPGTWRLAAAQDGLDRLAQVWGIR